MTERHAELDSAFERVMTAARAHLLAVKSADGRADDDEVWRAYVELNNASFDYDELLLDLFGEVTPWDVESIDPDEAERQFAIGAHVIAGEGDDPHPRVISVRQRRDYRVSSVSALLHVAESIRLATDISEDMPVEPVESVGEAILELMQAGDGSLGSLDVPELEPLDGVVVVAEVDSALDPATFDDTDVVGPFSLGERDRLIDRLDEHTFIDVDDEGNGRDGKRF